MNYRINLLFISILVLLVISSVSAELVCDNRPLNNSTKTSNFLFCKYYNNEYGPLVAGLNLDNQTYAVIKTEAKNIEPNLEYSLDIEFNIDKSSPGYHSIQIVINNIPYNYRIYIDKPSGQDINYIIDYNNGVNIKLSIINNENSDLQYIIKSDAVPVGFNNVEEFTLIAKSYSTTTTNIKLNYINPQTGVVRLSIINSKDNKEISIPIYKQNINISSANNQGLFILANANVSMIVLIVILFIIAVILFAMFISRFTKVLIKKDI